VFSQDQTDLERIGLQIIFVLLILSSIGLIMVYSSSYIYAKDVYGSSAYFFLRQLAYFMIGLSVAFLVSKTKFSFWMKYGLYINLLCTILLISSIIPGVGKSVKGASRWVEIGPVGIQPSEAIKFSLMVLAIPYFENFSHYSLKQKCFGAFGMIIPLTVLIKQPDFGSFTICFLVIGFICFLSRFPRKYFYGILMSGLVFGFATFFLKAYRIKRLLTFLDPWKNPKTSGFQIIQSYLAFANGSFFGQGLGNSNEKLFYLPEAHNDFIFSVIGEELGFLGVFLIIAMFICLIYLGYKFALRLNSRFAFILASTIIFSLGLQSVLNMGVVLGLLPTKGLNLPFISYGGSSLVCNFFSIGLLFSAMNEKTDHSYIDT
tara:strand:+ start:4008 stop:5129 length:1122 start_codon:yes stop_codon:yes gene_type:complete